MSKILDNIFINLRVISKIAPKGRISTTSPGQVKLQNEGYATKAWRTLTGDSREKSVKLLLRLANDVTEISDNIIDSLYYSKQYEADHVTMFQMNATVRKCHQLKKLARELGNCEEGLHNLLNTYRKDIHVTANIEEVEDKFNEQIEKINKALKHIEPDTEYTIHTQHPQHPQCPQRRESIEETNISMDPFE